MAEIQLGKFEPVLAGGNFHLDILIPALVVAGTIARMSREYV